MERNEKDDAQKHHRDDSSSFHNTKLVQSFEKEKEETDSKIILLS